MPLYEYQCEACGKRFEIIQKFSDAPAETCAKCGAGPVRRLISSPAIQFKGSGWYITDYAQKGNSGGDQSASGSSKSTPAADGGTKEKASAGSSTSTTESTPAAAPASKD